MSEYIITCNKETALLVANDVDSMKLIIRCRNCRFCMAYMAGTYCDYMAHAIEPNGYCAWGERKEGSE